MASGSSLGVIGCFGRGLGVLAFYCDGPTREPPRVGGLLAGDFRRDQSVPAEIAIKADVINKRLS